MDPGQKGQTGLPSMNTQVCSYISGDSDIQQGDLSR